MIKPMLGSIAAFSALVVLAGCGGSGGGSAAPVSSTTVTAVDPYIQDATFFYDANTNGIYDNGEQVSTLSGRNGACTFSPALPEGARVVMKAKGIHVGVPFEGQLSADLSSTGVVSPITTLGTKGYSDSEVVALLEVAGILLSVDDLDKDPMAGLGDSSTAEDLKKIQASVAVNTFLKLVGTGITKAAIEADAGIKTKLQNCITFSKNAITEATVTGSNLQAAVNSAVAVSNYIAADTTGAKLTDLSAVDPSALNTLMTSLTTQYLNSTDPEATFGLDDTGAVTEVASMTAAAYFNYFGSEFGLQYSDTVDARGDHFNPDWTHFEEMSLAGSNFTYSYTGFGLDWKDENSNGNYNEHLPETDSGTGTLTTTATGRTFSGTVNGVDRDGTTFSGRDSGVDTINGNEMTSTWTFTASDGSVTETSAEKEVFISAEKVTEIAGVSVGPDVYRVTTKQQNGQLDSNGNFLAIGDGYDLDGAWDCSQFANMTAYVQFMVTNGSYVSNNIKFAPNGAFVYADTNATVEGAYWRVTADDILEKRYYAESDIRIVSGQCQENWIGSLHYNFTNVTKAEANSIMQVLIPGETLIFQ